MFVRSLALRQSHDSLAQAPKPTSDKQSDLALIYRLAEDGSDQDGTDDDDDRHRSPSSSSLSLSLPSSIAIR